MRRWKSRRPRPTPSPTGTPGAWHISTPDARASSCRTRTLLRGLNNSAEARFGVGRGIRSFLRQVAVEEHVAAHLEHTVFRPMTLAERGARLQANRRPAVTDEERRHRHVQAIEQAGG